MRQGKRSGWLANGSSECFAVNGVCCEARNRGDAVMLAEPIEVGNRLSIPRASAGADVNAPLPPFMGLMQREFGR